MKMSRYIGFFLLLITVTGCIGNRAPYPIKQKAVDSTEVSRIILTYSEKLKYDKKLHLEDSVVYYNSKINRIRLDFSSMENFDLWQARELLVDLVDEFLDRINANSIIYSDLSRTPFTASDLEVYIHYKSFYNHFIDLRTVGLVTLRQGIASYIASDGISCETACWHKRNEYYFQSRNFVNFKRQGEALYKPKYDTGLDTAFDEDERVIDLGPNNRGTVNRGAPRVSIGQ